MSNNALYRTIWRWHFYAGVFVIPFVLILAVSGAVYLFKPQIDRWEERAFQGLPTDGALSPSAQAATALLAFPNSTFLSYRLPERSGDAAMVHVALSDSGEMRDVFVSPQGIVLGSMKAEDRIIAIDRRLHGQLFLGPKGSWLVELVASWALVMIVTGLFLWWPRGRGVAGVLWPRLSVGGRGFWRDLHAVIGFWISGFVIALLVSGLPWAAVWGGAFEKVRNEMGWVKGARDWTLGGAENSSVQNAEHRDHDHASMMHHHAPEADLSRLNDIVAKAVTENLAFPVVVIAPNGPMRGDTRTAPAWAVVSETQNRPLQITIHYDAVTGEPTSRQTFADKHVIDRVVGYGTAWHEGQLFGWINQLIGLLTAAGLIVATVSGFIMWRRRKPAGQLGAPAISAAQSRAGFATFILIVMALLLPLLAASLIVLLLLDLFVLPRIPGLRSWLGLSVKETA